MSNICSIAENVSFDAFSQLYKEDIINQPAQWDTNPYPIVLGIQEYLKNEYEDFNQEWFIEQSSAVFKEYGKVFSAKLLEINADTIPKFKSSLFPQFAIKEELSELFKGSLAISSFTDTEFNNQILGSLFYNQETNDFIISDKQFNNEVIALKNKLFNNIKVAVGSELKGDLYEANGELNYKLYSLIMTEASKLPSFNKKIFEGSILDETFRDKVVAPYYSFITLLHFDKLIDTYFKGVIKVDNKYKNTLNSPANGLKYTKAGKGTETEFWMKENEGAHDPSLFSSPTVRKMANSIPLYDHSNNLLKNNYSGKRWSIEEFEQLKNKGE